MAIDLHNNCLDTDQVDAILALVDSWNTNWGAGNGILNLAGNRPPSAAGQAHATALASRNWTVTTETLTSAARPAGVFGDDFHRADCVGISAIGNGWFSPDGANASITSGVLTRTDTGAFRRFLNQAGGLLPPDYTVVARIPGATLSSFFGLVGRWFNGDGVQAFFNNSSTAADLAICSASSYMNRPVAITTLAAFPASWSNTSIDHTFALQLSGTTATVILDGVAVVQGTIPYNATVWGTGYGLSGEGQTHSWYSIGTTVATAAGATLPIALF